jgi:transcriptional regulator with XRE-family HTH domain
MRQTSRITGTKVIIGERLRALREYKALSQVDMEKRTGLFRYYISRVENGHTIPTLETLTRFARALEVPVFHLVYEEDGPYQPPVLPGSTSSLESSVTLSKRDLHLLDQFNHLFGKLHDRDRHLLVSLARRMIKRATRRSPSSEKAKSKNKTRALRPRPARRISSS